MVPSGKCVVRIREFKFVVVDISPTSVGCRYHVADQTSIAMEVQVSKSKHGCTFFDDLTTQGARPSTSTYS